MRVLRLSLLAGAAALLGCGSATETDTEGRILVTVTTRGAEPQSEQFLLTLNGARPAAVAPNGSAIYDGVPEGTHVVHLFSLADNCAVSGSPTHREVALPQPSRTAAPAGRNRRRTRMGPRRWRRASELRPGNRAVKHTHLPLPLPRSYVRRMTPCMTTMLKRRGRGGCRTA